MGIQRQNFAAFVEDVILVAADGFGVLSKGMPYTADEIEKLISQKSIIEADDDSPDLRYGVGCGFHDFILKET